MSEEKPATEYTDEEKREIEEQIREFHPQYNGVLDELGEVREKLQVVDKRRFRGRVGPDLPPDRNEQPVFDEPPVTKDWLTGACDSAIDQIDRATERAVAERNESIQNAPNFSPSANPDKPIGMDFSTAMQQVVEGKRVTRLEWGNPDEWLMMFMWSNINPKTPAGRYLTIHHADGAMHPLYINDGDLTGNDWVVVS